MFFVVFLIVSPIISENTFRENFEGTGSELIILDATGGDPLKFCLFKNIFAKFSLDIPPTSSICPSSSLFSL